MSQLKDKLQQAAVNLEKAKSHYEAAQEEYDSLFAKISGKAKRIKNGDEGNGNGMSLKAQVMDLLLGKTDGMAVMDIVQALNSSKPTVQTLLYALKKEGKVEKIGKGIWKVK